MRFLFIISFLLASVTFAENKNCKESEKDRWLDKKSIIEDIDELSWILKSKYSYFSFHEKSYQQQIQEYKNYISQLEGDCLSNVVFKLAHFIAQFGDGHTFIRKLNDYVPAPGFLPFSLGMTKLGGEIKYVAYQWDTYDGDKKSEDQKIKLSSPKLYQNNFPYLSSLDGVSIDKWKAALLSVAAVGRETLNDNVFLGRYQNVNVVRKVLGLPFASYIEGEFENKNHKKVKRKIDLIPKKFSTPNLPVENSRILEETNIGYIRIPRLDFIDEDANEFVSAENVRDFFFNQPASIYLRYWMEKFKPTEGLVIDIRNAGGGYRYVAEILLPYLIGPNEQPIIYNVTGYQKRNPGTHPYFRFYRTAKDKSLSARESSSIRELNFKPQNDQIKGLVKSEWYFAITQHDPVNAYHYNKPVVVLINEELFSAGDNVANALCLPINTYCLGNETGGGSSGPEEYKLKNSRIELRASYMISMKHNGELYETRGVIPDEYIYPNPDFFIGKADNVLERAKEFILNRKKL